MENKGYDLKDLESAINKLEESEKILRRLLSNNLNSKSNYEKYILNKLANLINETMGLKNTINNGEGEFVKLNKLMG